VADVNLCPDHGLAILNNQGVRSVPEVSLKKLFATTNYLAHKKTRRSGVFYAASNVGGILEIHAAHTTAAFAAAVTGVRIFFLRRFSHHGVGVDHRPGNFRNYNGSTRNFLARLNSNGAISLQTAFLDTGPDKSDQGARPDGATAGKSRACKSQGGGDQP